MTTIQIQLPDATAKAAQEAGLLTPQVLDTLLADPLKRRQAADSLLSIPDRVGSAGTEPMPMPEIVAEVKASRGTHRPTAPGTPGLP
jgi:hypothetical protein